VHTPLQAARADYDAVGDLGSERLRVYAAMVRALDRSVGRILDALEAEGLSENTLIVFTSDNGGAGYIGIDDINKPYRGWKMTLFEGGLRVPLMVSWPGRIPANSRHQGPAAHIDLMPTLASAAGASLPAGVDIDGVDLMPFATGARGPDDRPHEALFWQSAYYRAVRSGDWKLQTSENPKRTWLFNLADDPTETRDLSRENPGKVAELTALLAAHHANAREPLYPFTVEGAISIDHSLAHRAPEGAEYVYWPN
jgi:arylsulfatase A-like enzyme